MSVKTLDSDLRWTLLNALRNGTVPDQGTDEIAVGLDDHLRAIEEGLDHVARGRSGYKFLRGEYGAGKTFLSVRVMAQAAPRQPPTNIPISVIKRGGIGSPK